MPPNKKIYILNVFSETIYLFRSLSKRLSNLCIFASSSERSSSEGECVSPEIEQEMDDSSFHVFSLKSKPTSKKTEERSKPYSESHGYFKVPNLGLKFSITNNVFDMKREILRRNDTWKEQKRNTEHSQLRRIASV
jgi:hypothetical protein